MYVLTNHLYIGDIFLVNSNDVIRPNLSVREGIGKTSIPLSLKILEVNIRECVLSYVTLDLAFTSLCCSTPVLVWEYLHCFLLFFTCRNCCVWGHVHAADLVDVGSKYYSSR